MSLPKAEVRRLFKRRVTRIFLVLTLLGLAIFPVAFAFTSQKTGPEQLRAAEATARANYEQALVSHQRMVAECEAAKAAGATDTDMRYGPDCGKPFAPTPEMFSTEYYLPFQFNFRQEFPVSLMVFSAILALVAFVIGASFVGAEWHSGGMMNLLLWRPRRIPVLLTKLGVVLGSMLGLTAVLGALWTVAFWAIGRYDGVIGGMTAGAWQSFALTGARGATLVLLATVVGFCLASFGRHTAMALGVGIGAIVISEIGLRIALELVQVRFGERYIISTYVTSWLNKEMTIYDYRSCDFVMGSCSPAEMTLTWQDSSVVFGVGLVVVLVAALWSIRRRDIT